MCAFLKIHVLKIFIERWFWELNMLIGSLVELHVRLHSCLCFFLKKLFLKAGSTPPRYFAVCRASSAFSYRNPDSFSIPGGSIENGFASSIASWHLVDRSSFCSWFCWVVPRHLSYQWPFSRHLPRQISQYLSTPASIEIYCWHYLSSLCNLELISFDISLYTSLFSLPNFLISLQSLFLKDFSSFFKNFFTW